MLEGTSWAVRKPTFKYRLRKRFRTISEQASESYLRVDIPCGSESCPVCHATLPALGRCTGPSDHYMIPDAGVLRDFLELFEVPDVADVVYLTSVVRPLMEDGNMRKSTRLRALYSDKRRRCYLFDNLHHLDTAACCGTGNGGGGGGADLLAAADWYYEHLGSRLPIVVVSDSMAAVMGAAELPAPSAAVPASTAAGTAGTAALGGRKDEGEDAELEALLRQMDINPEPAGAAAAGSRGSWLGGGAWGGAPAFTSGAAGAGAAAGGDDLAFLDSLPSGLPPAAALGKAVAAPPQLLPLAAAASSSAEVGAAYEAAATPAAASAPAALPPGVHVLSTAQYFSRFYWGTPAVWDAYESRVQSLAEEAQQGGSAGGPGAAGGYRPHLSTAAVEAGLSQGTLLQGSLSINRRMTQEGTVHIGGELGGARQVLVRGKAALNRAVHGDTVAVRLLPREQWLPATALSAGAEDDEDAMPDDEADLGLTLDAEEEDATAEDLLNNSMGVGAQPTGEVVAIVARGAGEIVATIAEEDERALTAKGNTGRQEAVLCVPLDRRLPKIRLRSRQLHRLLGARLVVRIDGWERGSNYPHGHLVRLLGPVNDLTAETNAVLVSSGVHWEPFTEGALRELPQVTNPQDWQIPPAELASRRDLRGPEHFVCSIDPPGCTDVDDALSVRWLGGGQVEVGVHIADVSYFVRQGSLLDAEATSRCTTVYLVDRRLDMLPALLSEQLCSLRGGQERLAVSCMWVLREEDLGVESVWFGRTIIKSRYQLEYQQAQHVLEGAPPLPGHDTIAPADRPVLQRALHLLSRLAEARRGRRLAAGAVELESAELRFRTGPEGQPVGVDVKQEIPMMKIVAEMMIYANAAVGERIYRAFPRAALLRRHPPPRRDSFAEVLPLCESVGVELDFSTNASLSASLAAACEAAPPAVATLIKSLTTRAMSEAEYFCTGDVMGRGAGMSHFGLALPFYTHFTSPIRRYADVVAHRQLLAAVAAGGHLVTGRELEPLPDLAVLQQQAPPPLPPAEVSSKASVMNERHRTAKRAQKDCSDLYLLLLLHSQPHVEAASVYGVRQAPSGPALLVFVPKYHIKGVIHLVDRAGIPKPPLRKPGDEELQDPFVLAYRRGISVRVDEGAGSGKGEAGLSLLDSTSGAVLAHYRPLQRVWVELGADGSRAHGPALRMRLLADSHPAVLEAVRQGKGKEVQEAPAQQAQQAEQQGCGALPRGMPVRGSYRPPGLGLGGGSSSGVASSSKGAPGIKAPPPGFRALTTGAAQQQPQQQQAQQQSGDGSRLGWAVAAVAAVGMEAAGPGGVMPWDTSTAGSACEAEQAGSAAGEHRAGLLRIEAPRTAVEPATTASYCPGGGWLRQGGGQLPGEGNSPPPLAAAAGQLLQAAVRRLRSRASRYALRAAEGDPDGARARVWAGRASSCRVQLEQLERQMAAIVRT